MDIQWINIDNIKPYEKNAKLHPEKQIEKLAKEITEVGWTQPIVVDKNLVIVAGHGRRLAAIKAGITEVPVHVLPASISNERIRAIRLFDNKTAETGWDANILKAELIDIANFEGFSNDWVGYDFQELVEILPEDHLFVQDYLKHKDANNEKADNITEIETNKFNVKRGQVWQLGKHRIMCGDSTSEADVAKLLEGKKADLIFTDPPYELSVDDVYRAIYLSGSDHCVLICTFKQAAEFYALRLFEFRFDFVINAHIPKSFMNHKQPYYTHQTGVYFSKNDCATIFDCKNAIGVRSENAYWHTIIDAPRNTQDPHGHAKSIKGIIDVLSGFDCNIIVDCFLGSGSTLIAAEKTGRTCVGMELSEHNCSIIINRFQELTGLNAQLISL